MKAAKHPSVKRVQTPVLQYAVGDLVRYRDARKGTWRAARVQRIGRKYAVLMHAVHGRIELPLDAVQALEEFTGDTA